MHTLLTIKIQLIEKVHLPIRFTEAAFGRGVPGSVVWVEMILSVKLFVMQAAFG